MSQIKNYMRAMVKERRKNSFLLERLQHQDMQRYEEREEIAEKLGIKTEDEEWWDESRETQHQLILEKIKSITQQ